MDSLIIDRSKRWTMEDYLQLEEEVKCEILNGELIMTPAPLLSHQRTAGLLYQKLASFINICESDWLIVSFTTTEYTIIILFQHSTIPFCTKGGKPLSSNLLHHSFKAW